MADDAAAAAATGEAAANIHATGIGISDRGIVIIGPPGSGKTTLALALVSRARAAGRHATLVCDDRLLLVAAGGRLVMAAAPSIEGLAEIYGIGPKRVPFERRIVADLVVRLAAPRDVVRMADPEQIELAGVRLTCVAVSERSIAMAIPVVFSSLGLAI